MRVKTFLKVFCVSLTGLGVLAFGSPAAVSQQRLESDGASALDLRAKAPKKKKEKYEDDFEFTAHELNDWALRQKISTRKYDKVVQEVMARRLSAEEMATTLRTLYPSSSYYDPFGSAIAKQLTAYAYTADVSDNPVEVNEAMDAYRALLRKHLANLEVVEHALMLARANPLFGERFLLRNIRNALRKDVRGEHLKGESPEEAYHVITYGEETYILAPHHVTVQKSEIYKVDKHFYNVHDVVYDDNGRVSQLYFDVTWPFYLYQKTRALRAKEEKVSIPIQ